MPPNVQLISVYFRNLVNAFTSDSKACWNTKLNFLVCLFVFPAFVILLCGHFLGFASYDLFEEMPQLSKHCRV